jgi:hypothetical protein
MADPGWGFASGFLTGTQQQQAIQLNNIAIQEGPLTLEKERLANETTKTALDQHKKLIQLLDSVPKGGQDPVADATNTLLQIGESEIKSGLIEEGTATFGKASMMMNQQSEIAKRAWDTTLAQTKYADGLLSTVHDQASWDQMNSLVQLQTGKPSALKDKPYSPELVESLRQASAAKRSESQQAYDKARTHKIQTDDVLDQHRKALVDAQTALDEARTDNVKKTGAVGAIPKSANVSAVADALHVQYGDDLDTATARAAARPIALEAERLMRDEKMKQPQAVTKAIRDEQLNGTLLVGIKPNRTQAGRTEKNARPLPMDSKGKLDITQMKPNMWYKTPSGEAGYYDPDRGLVVPDAKGDDGGGDEDEGDE